MFDLFVMIWTVFVKFSLQEHLLSDRKEGLLATLVLKECHEGRVGEMEEKRQL